MSRETTRLAWSDAIIVATPACHREHLGRPDVRMGWTRRRSIARLEDESLIVLDRWLFRDGHEWYVSVREWSVCEVRLHGLGSATRWPEARAAALLSLDALLGSRLSIIARARR